MSDWVDGLSHRTGCYISHDEPVWWGHPLVHSIGLPLGYPSGILNCDIRTKAFIFFLSLFDPPKNFQGFSHLLEPLNFVVKDGIKRSKRTSKAPFLALGSFIDVVEDYISLSPPDEQRVLKANKLSNIQKLGIWRFHFHCGQFDRERIDLATDWKAGNRVEKVIDSSNLRYLRDGPLDPLYMVMAIDITKLLHRRNWLRKLSVGDASRDQSLIYSDVLASEHCVHLGHHLIEQFEELGGQVLLKEFKSSLRAAARKKRSSLGSDKIIVKKILSHIQLLSRLIATGGSVRKLSRKQKKASHNQRIKTKRRRLLPHAEFDDTNEEAEKIVEGLLINEPFNIFIGQVDDDLNEVGMKRRIGRRPKVSGYAGESDDDYTKSNDCFIPASWVADPYQNKLKQDVQIESLILNLDPPVWSSACLSVPTIIDLHTSLENQGVEVNLALLLMLHVGLSFEKLSQLRFGVPDVFLTTANFKNMDDKEYLKWLKDANQFKDFYIHPETFEMFYLLPKDSIAYYSDRYPDFVHNCKNSINFVQLDFPPIIKTALKKWKQDVFVSENPDIIGYDKVFNYWKNLGERVASFLKELGARNGENITLSRIKTTFRALYIGQASLTPIFANVIMHQIPNQYKAQHFYTNIDMDRLHDEYHKASNLLTTSIYGSQLDRFSQDSSAPRSQNIGSRLVPKKDWLREYFLLLYYAISHERQHRNYAKLWNVYVLYSYRLLQLLTGIRTVKDGYPDWGDISFTLNWLRISDKDNVHFYEVRVIPLVSVLKSCFENLAKLQKKIFVGENFSSVSLSRPFRNHPTKDIFVYCDLEKQEIVPLNKNHFSDIENLSTTADIPDLKTFHFKDNALRHFLSSTLIEYGTDQHLIDFIMGHKHFGFEAFGKYSLVEIEKYQNQIESVLIEAIYTPIMAHGLPKVL